MSRPSTTHRSRLTAAIALLVPTLCLGGCVFTTDPPEEFKHIAMEGTNSPLIAVQAVRLARYRDGVYVTGYVTKTFGVLDTWTSHLDVSVYDPSGALLLTTVGHFQPRNIPPGPRGTRVKAHYAIRLDPLPASAARIEVRAHRGDHPPRAVE